MTWVDDVLHFWFEELETKDWFATRPALDDDIRKRFGALLETQRGDPPDVAALDARAHLATVIVLDQFSRNVHRGTADAFAADAAALQVTLHAMESGLDRTLPPHERRFLYMPLMHSEDPAMQTRSIDAFASLDMPEVMRFAEGHRRTVERFGRFPSRNAALGRASTDAERVEPDPENP
jgi:uncharacterized protein (DUF924 family)